MGCGAPDAWLMYAISNAGQANRFHNSASGSKVVGSSLWFLLYVKQEGAYTRLAGHTHSSLVVSSLLVSS